MERLRTMDADTLLYEPLEKPLFVVDGLIPTAGSSSTPCKGYALRPKTTPTQATMRIYPSSKTSRTDTLSLWWRYTISESRTTAMCSIRFRARRG